MGIVPIAPSKDLVKCDDPLPLKFTKPVTSVQTSFIDTLVELKLDA